MERNGASPMLLTLVAERREPSGGSAKNPAVEVAEGKRTMIFVA